MKVTITYFKDSGKYYSEDQDVEWPPDKSRHDGWCLFADVVRIKTMFAVCMNAPMGFPQFYQPNTPDRSRTEEEEAGPDAVRTASPKPKMTPNGPACPTCNTEVTTCGRCGGIVSLMSFSSTDFVTIQGRRFELCASCLPLFRSLLATTGTPEEKT